MKIFSSLLLALLFTSLSAHSQNGFDTVYNFCHDPDRVMSISTGRYADTSKILCSGVSVDTGTAKQYSYLCALDYSGKKLWRRDIVTPGLTNGVSADQPLIKLSSGNYLYNAVIIDVKVHPDIEVMYPYFYMFNADGDSVMYMEYKKNVGADLIQCMMEHNNHIITGGIVTSDTYHKVNNKNIYDSSYVCLRKYDLSGEIIWEKRYMRTTGNFDINKVTLSADGSHYVFAGRIKDTSTHNGSGSCIIKTDTAGNMVWVTSLPKEYWSDAEMDIIANPGGGYYFVSSWSTQPDMQGIPQYGNIYYGKLDEQGDTLWTRIFSDSLNYAQGHRIEWAHDGNLVIFASGNQGHLPALLKVDTAGNIHWVRTYQRIYNFGMPLYVPSQILQGFSQTPYGSFFFSGYIESNGPMPGYDAPPGISKRSWFVLADSSGCRYDNDPACWPLSVASKGITPDDIKVYPNPVADWLYIDLHATHSNDQALATVIDITGRTVKSVQLYNGKNAVDMAGLPPAVYIVKVAQGSEIVTVKKIFKQ